MNRVYIILVNWNGWRDTLECLESVFRLDYPDFRVVVCDNGSTDASLDLIRDWAQGKQPVSLPAESGMCRFSCRPCGNPLEYIEYRRETAETGGDASVDPPLVLIRNGLNLGFAGGNNVGMRYALARGDFSHVWLLNNDTVVDYRALTALVERMAEKPAAGMCGSTIYYHGRPDALQALGGGWHCKWIGLPWHYGRFGRRRKVISAERAEARMNYVEGASMLVSKSFLMEVGLMCEDYFLFFEELDWAIRAKGRFTLAYAPESIVYHKVGGSIGTSSDPRKKSAVCDYYSVRNRIYFTRRFYSYALPTVYLALFFTLLSKLALRQFDRAKMIGKLLFNFAGEGPGYQNVRSNH